MVKKIPTFRIPHNYRPLIKLAKQNPWCLETILILEQEYDQLTEGGDIEAELIKINASDYGR